KDDEFPASMRAPRTKASRLGLASLSLVFRETNRKLAVKREFGCESEEISAPRTGPIAAQTAATRLQAFAANKHQ
ncbi:MAG TPA: hypothetical protein VF782_14630, partial [Allosphingosinicella sp.]